MSKLLFKVFKIGNLRSSVAVLVASNINLMYFKFVMTYSNRPWFKTFAAIRLLVTTGVVVQALLTEFGNMSSDYLDYSVLTLVLLIVFEFLLSPGMIDLDLDQQKIGIYIPDRRYAYLGLGKQLSIKTWEDQQRLVIQTKKGLVGNLLVRSIIESKRGGDVNRTDDHVSKWMGVGFYNLSRLKGILRQGIGRTNHWVVKSLS